MFIFLPTHIRPGIRGFTHTHMQHHFLSIHSWKMLFASCLCRRIGTSMLQIDSFSLIDSYFFALSLRWNWQQKILLAIFHGFSLRFLFVTPVIWIFLHMTILFCINWKSIFTYFWNTIVFNSWSPLQNIRKHCEWFIIFFAMNSNGGTNAIYCWIGATMDAIYPVSYGKLCMNS